MRLFCSTNIKKPNMSKLYFFRARETKRPMLQKNTTSSVLGAVFLLSFWVQSIGIMRWQTASNISYTTPQTYLFAVQFIKSFDAP